MKLFSELEAEIEAIVIRVPESKQPDIDHLNSFLLIVKISYLCGIRMALESS